MIERYGGTDMKVSRKEKRRMDHAKRGEAKVDEPKEDSKSDIVAEVPTEKKSHNKWDRIYGETSNKMSVIMSKQVSHFEDRLKKKDKKKGGKKQ